MYRRYSTIGRPRASSEAQVAAALEWQRTRKSAAQLARELGVCVQTLMKSIKRPDLPEGVRLSGKQRALKGAALAAAREWHRSRRFGRQRAFELGMTYRQFQEVIKRNASFKSAPPEKRTKALLARRLWVKRLELRGLT